jgi:hypothetical protein
LLPTFDNVIGEQPLTELLERRGTQFDTSLSAPVPPSHLRMAGQQLTGASESSGEAPGHLHTSVLAKIPDGFPDISVRCGAKSEETQRDSGLASASARTSSQ